MTAQTVEAPMTNEQVRPTSKSGSVSFKPHAAGRSYVGSTHGYRITVPSAANALTHTSKKETASCKTRLHGSK